MFQGSVTIGHDHRYDAQKLCLRLALDPKYIEGYVEGCLERIREDHADKKDFYRDLWEDEGEREPVLEILKAECEVLPGRLENYLPY